MAYTIELNESLAIVNVVYKGDINLDTRMRAQEQVCSKHSHLKPLKILVDERELILDLSFDEQQAFGQYSASNPELTDARVAVLHEPDFNSNAIIDDSAFNSGYLLAQSS